MSSIKKNVSGQKWVVYAWNDTTHAPVTGDAANITAKISQDGAAGSATTDTNPTELEDGYYVFDLTQGETNADLLLILPESSTSNVRVEGAPRSVYTTEEINYSVRGVADSGSTTTMVDAARTEADTDYWKGSLIRFLSGSIAGQTRLITGFTPGTDTITFAPAATQAVGTNDYEILPWGDVDLVNTVTTLTGHTPQTGDNYARLGAPAGASVSADVAAIQSDTDDIQSRLPAALVSGRIDASIGAIATGAITADSIAADAIGASELATDAVNEIRDAILADSTAFNGADIASILTDTTAIEVDTQDIQSRLPAALVSGRIDANVGAISDDATAADNLELMYDGTGYIDPTAPASRSQISSADASILQDTTIATLATQVSFTLTDGSSDDDAYNGCLIVIEDASTSTQKAVVIVDDYEGSGKTITLRAAPAFTIAVSDKVTIIANIGHVEEISIAAQGDIQNVFNTQGYSVARSLKLDYLDKSVLEAEEEVILAMTQPDTLP